MVFSAFGSHCGTGVSLLADAALMRLSILSLQVTGDRVVVADVAVKTFEFSVSCGSCAQYWCGETPLLSAVRVVPGCVEADSF